MVSVFMSSLSHSQNHKSKSKVGANQLEFLGIEHNKMLDKVYKFIKNNELSDENGKLMIENFLVEQISSNEKYTEKSNQIGINYIRNLFDNKIDLYKLNYKPVINPNIVNNYINELENILDSFQLSDDSVIMEIKNLEDDIEKSKRLSESDMIALFSSTQIAQYSINYWTENLDKWLSLENPESNTGINQKMDGPGPGGKIAAADAAGAIGGAAGAWAVNIVPGAGQAAYGGAILGGAVGGSVATGVSELLDYFGW